MYFGFELSMNFYGNAEVKLYHCYIDRSTKLVIIDALLCRKFGAETVLLRY